MVDCHIHMVLDGVNWKDAIARHKAAPQEALIRQTLGHYQALGFSYLRDGGDRWGVCDLAAKLAPEYGIRYRSPGFPIYKTGHYGGFIGRGFDGLAEYRALVVERDVAEAHGFEIVNAIPQLHAGGSFAMTAWANFKDPVLVETIVADAGLDIGGTLIGMHLRRVAIPVRLSIKKIGEANILCARTRPKYIGGARAVYQDL